VTWKEELMSALDLQSLDLSDLALLNRPEVKLLSVTEERSLLLEFVECKTLLLQSRSTRTVEQGAGARGVVEVQDVVRDVLKSPATASPEMRQLAPIAARYNELRTRLAMANLRLVAHVSRRYRNRGLAPADLLQEGFCGLLKAIDRFDCTKETRLASYAVWWIRQAIQRAVAAGAYPVRLNPRHLQQLAEHHPDLAGTRKPGRKPRSAGALATIRQIHSATRPTVSLNAGLLADDGASLLGALAYPPHEEVPTEDLDDYLESMIRQLKPREQFVIQLRFGLGGKQSHSLSQVSALLDVSKERIRQIQEGALKKLRGLVKNEVYSQVSG
jgi:RNA polymerase primary sigma factor